jgi:putative ABC transport system permease protein
VLHLAWRGVRGNVGRYVATLVAIITGVGFFAATGFIGQQVIDSLEGDVDRQYGAVDVAVVPDVDQLDASSAVDEIRIPGDVADAIAQVDGVDAVAGILAGPVSFLGDDGDPTADGATGRLWVADDELNPVDVDEGDAPDATGEVALDRGLADDEDISVGDQVTLLSVAGQTDVTVVGLTRFGSEDAIDDGGTVSISEADAFDLLAGGQEEYDTLYLRGDGDPADLRDAVADEVPDGFVDQTGDEFRADQRDQVGSFGRIFKQALQGFAILALLVGGFVIYNTFSVIVAQRLRELAVLAAIGATPKQIKRSLSLEGLVIGLLGSVLGVVLAFVLSAVLDALGVAIAKSGGGLAFSSATAVQAVWIGTIITYVSVRIPARRAARTEPIEALRDAALEAPPTTRRRIVTTVVLLVLGVLLLAVGSSAVGVGLGALLLAVGVVVAGPIIALGGGRLLRPIAARLGLEAQLAVDNVARNPQRTATTANALLIGVFLVTLVTVAGTSVRNFALDEIGQVQSADYLVASTGGTIDDDLVDQLGQVDDVDSVTAFRRDGVTIDGDAAVVSSGDTDALLDVTDIEVVGGSLDDLTDGAIAVLPAPDADPPDLGTTVTVASSTSGAGEDLEVVAILESSFDGAQVGSLVSSGTFDSVVGDTAPTAAFLDVADGAGSDTEDAIDDLVERRPDITVTAGNAIGKLVAQVFDFLINAVNGLLLMSVLVALIGIVNTLSLSILERRRELGLLRVVGMTDRRVRRMVRFESVLIAVIGTVTGLVLGLAIAFGIVAAIDRLADADIGFDPSLPRLGIVLALGVVLGLLASLIPSARSTRLEVLDAIEAT